MGMLVQNVLLRKLSELSSNEISLYMHR